LSARILVTGAGGFVGQHLVPILTQKFPGAEITGSGFDVTNALEVKSAIEQIRPNAVLHLAAIAAVDSARLACGLFGCGPSIIPGRAKAIILLCHRLPGRLPVSLPACGNQLFMWVLLSPTGTSSTCATCVLPMQPASHMQIH